MYYGRDRPVMGFAANDILRFLVLRLLRFHPFVRARQLDGQVRNEDVKRLAVGGATVLG